MKTLSAFFFKIYFVWQRLNDVKHTFKITVIQQNKTSGPCFSRDYTERENVL